MSTQLEETLFLAAQELRDPSARAEFLAKSCADGILRARIEERLSTDGDVTLATPEPGRQRPLEKAGDTIGRYKLLQQIGEGGCGVVYMAEQTVPVRRKVALKVIKLGMDTKNVIARFEAERQALAMMDHANIAKVLDAGATEAGRPYFVMELVRGVPITQYCDDNNLATPRRLKVFIAVCHAIQHAHQKGIIHRDIKPSNILVTMLDDEPVPKVIDFGVAKATEARLTDLTLFTEVHSFIGTPAYMSPEQADLTGLDIDTRADIYSLGVLLYELLSGRLPFDPKKLLKCGLDEMRRTIREVEPPRPSTRLGTLTDAERADIARHRGLDAAQLFTLLRGDLDWIMMKTLEKDRTRRYDTANGLAMDIQRYLNNEPVVARPPSTSYLVGKLMRRYRGAVVAVGVVVLALLAGIGVSSWQALRARRAEKLASERFIEAQAARDAAERLTNEAILGLRKKLLALGKIEIMEDMVVAADEYYRKLPASLTTDVSTRHRASVYTNRSLIASALGQDDKQEEYTQEALRITEQLAAKNPDDDSLQDEAAYASLTLCMLYMDRNDSESVLKAADQVIVRCQAWLQRHPRAIWAMRYQVLAHNFAGQALARYLGKPMEAMLHFQLATQLTTQMREVAGETAEVCEAEGLIHYGNANIAGRTNRRDAQRVEFEASTASFARALELGGDSALLREMHVGAMHHAGSDIRTEGKAKKNEAEIQRGEAMVVKAFEVRAKLVELEPGRAEWWRDLAHSYAVLATYAAEKKDGALELSRRKETLRCRDEAVTRQKNRPLLYDEWAWSASDLASCLMKQTPPDTKQAADLTVRSIESWRRSVELGGMRTVGNHELKGDAKRLAQIATMEDGATVVALLQRVRLALEPLVGKVQGANDVPGALAALLGTQISVLESLGRTAEAAEVKTALERLTSGKSGTPRGTADLAKFLIEAAGPRLDAAFKLPAAQQPPEIARVEADAQKAIALLEPLVAREDNPDYCALLASAWRFQGRIHRARKNLPEAAAALGKALAQLGDEKNRLPRSDIGYEAGDVAREAKDYAGAVQQYFAAAKLRDALAAGPDASGNGYQRAAQAWSAVASAQQLLGEFKSAAASYDAAIQRQNRAHESQPERSEFRAGIVNLRINQLRLFAALSDADQALASIGEISRHLDTLLPMETDTGRLTGLNDNASDAQSKLRDIKAYTAVEKMLGQIIAIRQRLEALRAWPEDPAKTSIGAQITLAALLLEMKKEAESATALADALAAADRSARPAIVAEARMRARGLYDSQGKLAEAEREARLAYEATQQADLGFRAMGIAGDFAMTLARRKQFAEGEKVALAAWDLASTRTWPGEPAKLRHDLAGKITDLYRSWNSAEPSDARARGARQWRERQVQANPLEARLNDPDLTAVTIAWTWQMAEWIEAGKIDEYKRERTRLLQIMESRQHVELCQRAARLLPAEGAELARATQLAEFAFKATPASSANYDWYALAQGLSLIRQNRGAEALAVLQPALKATSPDRWFSIRALCVLAHRQAGETDKAQAVLQEIDKADARMQGYLKDAIFPEAAVARVLLVEARR